MQISGSFGGFFSILLLDKIYRWSFEIKKKQVFQGTVLKLFCTFENYQKFINELLYIWMYNIFKALRH